MTTFTKKRRNHAGFHQKETYTYNVLPKSGTTMHNFTKKRRNHVTFYQNGRNHAGFH